MATIAAIGVEGVLSQQVPTVESITTQGPVQTGLKLFVGLRSMFKIVLLTDELDTSLVEHFLKQNGIDGHAYLIPRRPWEVDLDHTQLRMHQLERLRGELGMPISLMVDHDPKVCAQAMFKGVVGLLFAHPQYARPEFRPDDLRGVKAWADIEVESARQRELKGSDPRLEPGLAI